MKKGEKGGTTKGMKMYFRNVAGLISKDKRGQKRGEKG